MGLDGKVVVITGGGNGLSRALGPGLAAEGGRSVATDIDEPTVWAAEVVSHQCPRR